MSRKHDPEGAQVKVWEGSSELTVPGAQPFAVRLDGVKFSKWVRRRHVERPFDPRLHRAMVAAALTLAERAGARYVYTQSDEVTLAFDGLTRPGARHPYGGVVRKLLSIYAAALTAAFGTACAREGIDVPANEPGLFDARVVFAETRANVIATLVWREMDAVRNSLGQAARVLLGPEEMLGVDGPTMRARLAAEGIPWGALSPERKFGSAFTRRLVTRPRTRTEGEGGGAHLAQMFTPRFDLPTEPEAPVVRHEYAPVRLPLRWGCTNAEAVVFEGAEPEGNGYTPHEGPEPSPLV